MQQQFIEDLAQPDQQFSDQQRDSFVEPDHPLMQQYQLEYDIPREVVKKKLPFFQAEGECIYVQDQCAHFKCLSVNEDYIFLVKQLQIFNINQSNCYYFQEHEQSAYKKLQREIQIHRKITQNLQTKVTRFGYVNTDQLSRMQYKEFSKTFCLAGSLLDILDSNIEFSLETKNFLSTQILQSLLHLHHTGFAHLSLRPSAVLLSKIWFLYYDRLPQPRQENRQQVQNYFLALTQNVQDIQADLQVALQQILNDGQIPLQQIPSDQREFFEQNFTQQSGRISRLRLSDQCILLLIKILSEELQQQQLTFDDIIIDTLSVSKYYQVLLDDFRNSISIQNLEPIFRPNETQRYYMAPELQDILYNGYQLDLSLHTCDMFSFGVVLAYIYGYRQQSYFNQLDHEQLKTWVQNMPQVLSEQREYISSMIDIPLVRAQSWNNIPQFLHQTNQSEKIQNELDQYSLQLNSQRIYYKQ